MIRLKPMSKAEEYFMDWDLPFVEYMQDMVRANFVRIMKELLEIEPPGIEFVNKNGKLMLEIKYSFGPDWEKYGPVYTADLTEDLNIDTGQDSKRELLAMKKVLLKGLASIDKHLEGG
jgi:hypothetical protein